MPQQPGNALRHPGPLSRGRTALPARSGNRGKGPGTRAPGRGRELGKLCCTTPTDRARRGGREDGGTRQSTSCEVRMNDTVWLMANGLRLPEVAEGVEKVGAVRLFATIVPLSGACDSINSTMPPTLNHCFKNSDPGDFFNTLGYKATSAPTHSERSQRYEICECFQTPGVSPRESSVCVSALVRRHRRMIHLMPMQRIDMARMISYRRARSE